VLLPNQKSKCRPLSRSFGEDDSISSTSRPTPPISSKRHPRVPNLNLGSVPNLTGRIDIINGPLCAGGFCDVYSRHSTCGRGGISRASCAENTSRLQYGRARGKAKKVGATSTCSSFLYDLRDYKKFRWAFNLWCSLRDPNVLAFHGTREFDMFRLFMVSPWEKGGLTRISLSESHYQPRQLVCQSLIWVSV
jgi:hypothetical protein